MREVLATVFWAAPLTAVSVWAWHRSDRPEMAVVTAGLALLALLMLVWEKRAQRRNQRPQMLWACPQCGRVAAAVTTRQARQAVQAHTVQDHAGL